MANTVVRVSCVVDCCILPAAANGCDLLLSLIGTFELAQSCVRFVQDGGIYIDFHDGSGDDDAYEDVYGNYDSSGGQ